MRLKGKRLYAKFERATWRNKTFNEILSFDARWMWIYLLTTPRTTKCPGLVDASILNIMEDLCWNVYELDGLPFQEKLARGIERTQNALDELSRTIREKDDVSWIVYSEEDKMILIPRAVAHNLPANKNIVEHWVSELNEYPDSEIKFAWTKNAFEILKHAFGKVDSRVKPLSKLYYGEISRSGVGHTEIDEANEAESNESIEQKQTVIQTVSTDKKKEEKNRSRTISTNISTNTSTNTMKEDSASEERKPKPPTPVAPDNFTSRQLEFFNALQETDFYIRGQGVQKAIEAVKDPVRLARSLGSKDLYPLVDPGLIGRLGAWSIENRTRAKTDIGKFILNRARATQEYGGRQNAQTGKIREQPTEYPHGDDLEAKVKNTR